MDRIVKNLLWCLHHFLLPCGDLVVKVTRCGSARDLSDRVNGDTPGCHGKNPVIDRKLVLLLLEQLLKLDSLRFVSVQPTLVLDLNNLAEGLVLWELSENTL